MRQDQEIEIITTTIDRARRDNRDLIPWCGYEMYCRRAEEQISDALPADLVGDALQEFEILEAQQYRGVQL